MNQHELNISCFMNLNCKFSEVCFISEFILVYVCMSCNAFGYISFMTTGAKSNYYFRFN